MLSTELSAQGPWGRGFGPMPTSTFHRTEFNDGGSFRSGAPFYGSGYRSGIGFGLGPSTAVPIAGSPFLYDPYATGRFRAPDLMDDPYFRARHKFDSRYPGRYARPPMRLKNFSSGY